MDNLNAMHKLKQMKGISNKQRKQCRAWIRRASAAAGFVAAGLSQIPLSDNALITPVQLGMTIALGRIFGIELTESAAKATILSMAGHTIGRTISQVLLGWIPIAGNAINATTAAGVTELLGWMIAVDFANKAESMRKEGKGNDEARYAA